MSETPKEKKSFIRRYLEKEAEKAIETVQKRHDREWKLLEVNRQLVLEVERCHHELFKLRREQVYQLLIMALLVAAVTFLILKPLKPQSWKIL